METTPSPYPEGYLEAAIPAIIAHWLAHPEEELPPEPLPTGPLIITDEGVTVPDSFREWAAAAAAYRAERGQKSYAFRYQLRLNGSPVVTR